VDLQIDSQWFIPERDWVVRYVHSSGPGGQNVNKVATKVELRFFLAQTRALSESQKQRLRAAFPSHVTRDGDFLLNSDRFRSQARNHPNASNSASLPAIDEPCRSETREVFHGRPSPRPRRPARVTSKSARSARVHKCVLTGG
jgi:ribosome-associated protein